MLLKVHSHKYLVSIYRLHYQWRLMVNWTEERTEQLKKLWAEGLSASQIASTIGNVTRNAVIGKVHRMGLSARSKPTCVNVAKRHKTQTEASSSCQSEPSPFSPSQPQSARVHRTSDPGVKDHNTHNRNSHPRIRQDEDTRQTPSKERKTILELTEYTCKWPIGDPGSEDFYFCGCKSSMGLPYCEHHTRIAYQPLHDRRKDRRAIGKVVAS